MKKQVLFLCTGNSCRSQMAEGLVNHYLGEKWKAYSAGTDPAGYLHPLAVQVMSELDIDIAMQRSKSTEEFREMELDTVVTVCDDAAETCCGLRQPAQGPPLLGLGQRRGVHGESRVEHLREDDEVRFPLDPLHQAPEHVQVPGLVLPVEGGLDEGECQILHRISAACSRVSSRLAKQKRRTRLSKESG